MKPLPASLIAKFYYATLAVILGVGVCAPGVTGLLLRDDQTGPAGQAVVLAGGLSSQITSLAGAYAAGDDTARQALNRSIAELIGLGSAADPQAPEPSGARLAGPDAQIMEAFIADAQAIANTPPGAPVASPLLRHFLRAAGALAGAEQAEIALHCRQQMQHGRRVALAVQFSAFIIAGLTLAAQALWLFRPLLDRIGVYTDEIFRLATTDPLTGLANRRGLVERGLIEQARAQRYHRPLSLLMLDADHFKRVNDTYGHDAGDHVLRSLARTFLQTLRQTDAVARLGGEEFAMLLTETDLKGAIYAAERIRLRVAGAPITFGKASISVTVSIGVTMVNQNAAGIEEALVNADELMYRAKSMGRNCVVASPIDYTDLEMSL